jgi:outer membrane protein assembly factor BamA
MGLPKKSEAPDAKPVGSVDLHGETRAGPLSSELGARSSSRRTEDALNLRPLICLCLLLIAPLAACAGGGANVRDGRVAAEIELTGNQAFDAATLREIAGSTRCDALHALDAAILAASEGGTTYPCKSAEDLASTLKFFYLDKGYLGADVRASRGGKAGRPRLVINEGELFRLGALEVVEADLRPADPAIGDSDELAALLPLRTGEPYSGSRVRAAIDVLRRRYVAAGYAEANVMPHVAIGDGVFQIDLCFEVERGARRSGPL